MNIIFELSPVAKLIGCVATGIIWLDFLFLSIKRTGVSNKINASEFSGSKADSEDKNLEDRYWEMEKNHFLNSLMGVLVFLFGNLTGNRDATGLVILFCAYLLFALSRVSYSISGHLDGGSCKNISNVSSILFMLIMLLVPVFTSIININQPF